MFQFQQHINHILIAVCCLISCHAHAVTELSFSIDQLRPVETDTIILNDLDLTVAFNGLQAVALKMKTSSVTLPYFNEIKSVVVSCELIKENQLYVCNDGILSIDHPLFDKQAKLSFSYHDAKGLQSFTITELFFLNGKHQIQGTKQQQSWEIFYTANQIDLPLLSSLVKTEQTHLTDYPVSSGILDIQGKIQIANDRFKSIQLDCNVSKLSIDADQVLEDVTLSSTFSINQLTDGWQYHNHTQFIGGAMYLIPGFSVFDEQPGFYLDLNQQPMEYSISGKSDRDFNAITIDSFSYQHDPFVRADGQGIIDIGSEMTVDYLDMNVYTKDLALTYPVYIQPILLATNYADLELSGSMGLSIRHEQEQLSYLKLILGELYIEDQLNRFSIANLNSQIQMEASEVEQTSTITWDSIGIYKLLFGAADMEFKSIANNYRVNKWQNVSLIDGGLAIDNFTLDNVGKANFKLTLDGQLQPISLATFTEVMQWPLMSGTLAGSISGFEYENNNLVIHGDIDFEVFDGNIVLSDVKIDNLFSSYSRTNTDITLSNLDLEQLTDTFTFGKVQGTLNGKMDNFTLENWQPVYFDAEFITPKKDDRPHRISQRALENLSEIGGGLSSALSGTLLKFIPEYSYGQFGLRCKLEKGVCHLGGVKETEDGFYILTRGGLLPPWVDVMGTGRSIQWDNLIEGLKQISDGEVRFE